ncbi:MAG: Ig-like domain-containing protein [Patescibacteria group bacterium]|nr:Ig-like domain-containing protein [Patescibacteria group bacterium]
MPKIVKITLAWVIYVLLCSVLAALLFFVFATKKVQGLTPEAYFDLPEIIKPDTEIRVLFNQPVRVEMVEESFRITPNVAGSIIWDEDGRGFTFAPENILEPGQKYVLAFSGINNYWLPFKAEQEIKIDTSPRVERVSPYEGQGVRSDSRIFVSFNKPVGGYYLDFKIKPEIDFSVEVDDEKKEFALIPKDGLEPEKTYEVEVWRRFLGKGGTGADNEETTARLEKIKSFSFSTLSPLELITNYPQNGKRDILVKQQVTLGFNKSIDLESFRSLLRVEPEVLFQIKPSANQKSVSIVPDAWEQDMDYRITVKEGVRAVDGSYLEEEKVAYFKTGNAGGVVKDERRATDDPVIKDGKYVDINLKSQLLGIYSDGIHLGTYRISSGKSGMQTPTGQYRVLSKERRHWSHKYKLWMPFSMQFTGAGHFIHELPEWPNGYKEGANHLGIPVSHGCVRLGVGPAETVFNFSEIGTVINLHY